MDKALRKLELQAKCGGDPSAFLGALARISPAALLKGRVELGLTTESQLACAAFLGHEVARKVEGYTIRFDESRPDPNDPTMLLVTRLRFKSIAWKCGSCRKKGRTAIVPYDDPDPLVPASCFGSC